MNSKDSKKGISLMILSFFVCLSIFAQSDTIKSKKYTIEYQLFFNANFNNKTTNYLQSDYNIKRTLIIYNQQLFKNFNLCLADDTYAKDQDKPPLVYECRYA